MTKRILLKTKKTQKRKTYISELSKSVKVFHI